MESSEVVDVNVGLENEAAATADVAVRKERRIAVVFIVRDWKGIR